MSRRPMFGSGCVRCSSLLLTRSLLLYYTAANAITSKGVLTMKQVSFALLSLAAVGCGPYLQYKSQPPAPAPAGKIIVEVRDSREPKVGGDKKELVGMQTGAFGIPTAIKV